MPARRRKRLDPSAFTLDVEKIREGLYSERSMVRAREILLANGRAPRVTLQISAECRGVIAGTDEAIAILKLGVDDWSALAVHALHDGDRVDEWETVMTVEGEFTAFAHLVSLCQGVLARRTKVSTNASRFVDAARPKPIMVFPSRHDHWLVQPGDAHAARIGGAINMWSGAPAAGRNAPSIAALPHSLIAVMGGSTVEAAQRFAEQAGEGVQVIAPVDYENDAVRTSLDVARALDGRLWGVHLATSEHLVDRSIIPLMGDFPPAGVNPQLVWNVRNALDAEGLGDIRILASGGFTLEKIRHFEEEGVPVDAYGIGAELFAGQCGFTADVVELDGVAQTRAGRERRENSRMERVK
jgi:nicotinate phosphoribosyltransferase